MDNPPVQQQQANTPVPPDDDEIDLVDLLKKIWQGRRYILYSLSTFALLGLFIALGTPSQYTSQVKLMPEVQGERSGGQLGGLAAQFGISAGVDRGMQGVPPNLYPEVTNALPLMQHLMNYEVYVQRHDTTVTMYTYVRELNPTNPVSLAEKYTIRLPFTMLGWATGLFVSEEEEPPGEQAGQPLPGLTQEDILLDDPAPVLQTIRMTSEQWEVVETLRDRISTSFDQESGMINVSVDMHDPEVAPEVAHQVVEYLKEYINSYQTQKMRENVAFIEERKEEAEERYERAQRRLAEFTDRHRSTMSQVDEIELQRLQNEYDRAFNLYNSISERLEQARIDLQEEVPVVNVLEPGAVPDRRSSPRRGLIMVVSVMLGGMVGLGLVFGKHMLSSIREQWDEY